MYLNILGLDFTTLDKPTIIFVLAGQVIVVAIIFFLYRLSIILVPAIIRFFGKHKPKDGNSALKSSIIGEDEENVEAAISMALYLHFNEIHDEESNVITIQRVSKTYSPWSSKLYNMRNFR